MGGVLKYLVVALVVGLGLWLWRARSRIGRGEPRPPGTARAAGAVNPQAMVACAHCGVHLPAADALPAGDHHYCCPAHRALGPVSR